MRWNRDATPKKNKEYEASGYKLFAQEGEGSTKEAVKMYGNALTGILASIHCSLVTQPPMGPMGPETS